MKSRIVVLFAGFAVLWCFLALRAARLQFLPHEQLKERHARQFQTTIHLEARRGNILDRKGRELAVSIKVHSLFADPKEIKTPRQTARALAKILGQKQSVIEAKIKDKNRRFVWIARKLDTAVYQEIQALKIRGLSFIEESRRIYPNDRLLAPVLGMVGAEGQGMEGLELSLDSSLRGQSKKLSVRRDARGRPLAVDGMMFTEVPEGDEIHLTIDSEIQHELEKELENATADFNADQAFGVIMDPHSGEIVAMGMSPGFDANRAGREPQDRRRNRSVTDVFEPGSVLKPFAVAAALEENLIEPRTRIDTENGRMKVGDRWIRESDQTHKWKSLTVSEVLALSSNIGITKIAMKVGDEKLRKYLELFGIGSRTGIELPGEARGALQPLPWRDHLLANISFGHGVATTPLQVAAAYSAIANGGIWREPVMIKSRRDSETGKLVPFHDKAPQKRIVMKQETAQALRLLLAGVTTAGTGTNARVEGFPVGGKTGTAQKADPKGRGYMQGAYISSFAGFIPANDPKYVIYIAVDHPKNRSYYGSQVAAPVFARMATFISRLEAWAPVLLAEKNLMPSDMKASGKAKLASSLNNSNDPLWSFRSQRSFNGSGGISSLEMSQDHVPDLQNLTVREVMAALNGQEIELRVEGSGVVHQTWPRAGETWQNKKKLVLQLKPFLRTERAVAPDYYRSSDLHNTEPQSFQ